MTFVGEDFKPGWVWLVGAGPGDPGLLTLHAAHALRQADTVIYDALVDERILRLARAGAVLEYAGKRGGKPSAKQRDISARLIELAQDGRRVLRLKGGDPFVFGRGGEEALALARAEIPFRIIPGLTAGIAGLTYAGIPLTHRGLGESVAFVTGHNTSGNVPDTVDWIALAKGAQVIVVYMALKHLKQICERLMDGGRNPLEPVAIIAAASTPRQLVVETTLSRCTSDAEAQHIQPPAIIVIGPVVRLRSALDWLGALQGKPLLNLLDFEFPAPSKQKTIG
ncbi:MAG: uroporphyrinogen-III C-methyltransferase [Alphaproteobacteria bacterium]